MERFEWLYDDTTVTEPVIVGYKLVRQGINGIAVLEQQVQELLDQGWQLHGGLRELRTENGHILMQPMVQYALEG